MPSLSPRPLVVGNEAGEGNQTLAKEKEPRQQAGSFGQTPGLVDRNSGNSDGSSSNEFHVDFRNYLYTSGIPAIFDALSGALLREKPDKPVQFILSWLRAERERALAQAEADNTRNSPAGPVAWSEGSKDDNCTPVTCSLSDLHSPL
ncbi:hypothetical protein TraAM80_03770 [Trypanosoma rangeli]|uniref:Uncharacterized protein n=1 Tax=Trypanosoma rangeli TaxID=5698 RepID=A0A3R7MRE3_TRYRA|nr:uncharacterized protein TraAM80_03770 [Trypanosoma rangeli]RNF06940.1 hypothetical protein TraAM80_03770 [Trypanosoma rangeli]|eukprot:RNF06940.1 hypothetical protein TraAM80_03770 [Trypanosoma rangeli]